MARAHAANACVQSDSIKGLAQSIAKPAYHRLLTAEPALRRAVPTLIIAFLVTICLGAFVQVLDQSRQKRGATKRDLAAISDLLADRIGRVKSIAAMAVLWSLATLLCGFASTYGELLAARVLVGVGEAAYGSVGIAVIISVFPERLRATLTGAFILLLVAVVALLQLIREKQLLIFQSPMFWIAGGNICYFTMFILTGFVGIQGKGGIALQQEKLVLLSVINSIRYLFFIAAAYAARQKEERSGGY